MRRQAEERLRAKHGDEMIDALMDGAWAIGGILGYFASYKIYRRLGAPRWAAFGFTDIALRIVVMQGPPSQQPERKRTRENRQYGP